ncbi:MAG: ATP-binding protein [Lachnospiraceae bacterium]|nr:ATP-binding protein [Lachnospiraceae bacterium]
MSLSNEKYEALMRRYDETRLKNEKLRRLRIKEVNEKLPEYKELSDEASAVSFSSGLRALNGEENALSGLNEKIREITLKKKELLLRAGFPEDYLEPVYSCPECKDTGYVNDKKCRCFIQAEIEELYRQANIAQILDKENFDTLTLDYYTDDELEMMKGIIDRCRNFVKNFDLKHDNLMFFGPPGVGKTFLTNCIAKELLDSGHSVIYFTSTQLFDTLATYIFRNKEASDEILRVHEDVFSCDLLVIDDLGTETSNNFVVSQLFLIINERGMRHKSTIISTNLAMSELSERYEERIVSRIIGNYTFINPRTGDLRFRIKKYGTN